jgi:hypothetical protein
MTRKTTTKPSEIDTDTLHTLISTAMSAADLLQNRLADLWHDLEGVPDDGVRAQLFRQSVVADELFDLIHRAHAELLTIERDAEAKAAPTPSKPTPAATPAAH